MPYVISQGITLHYQEHGTGPALVLLAGLACHQQTWSLILSGLASEFRVIVLDNRGVGQSTQQCGTYTLETMAQDVHQLLNHLRLEQVFVVGHSMGGMVAQAVAHHYPERIKAMVLASTAAKLPPHAAMLLQTSVKLLESPLALELLINNTLPWLYADNFLMDRHRVMHEVQAIAHDPTPQSPAAYAEQVHALTAFDYTAVIDHQPPQTLIVTGADDVLIPEKITQRQLQTRFSQAQWISLTDCGHMPQREQPEKLAASLRAFFGAC